MDGRIEQPHSKVGPSYASDARTDPRNAAITGWEASVAEAAVTQVARVGTVVRPRERLAVIADDPADDRVLEAAIEGGAELVVSGDRHLLRLSEWGGVEVVRAAVFVDRLGPRTRPTPG